MALLEPAARYCVVATLAVLVAYWASAIPNVGGDTPVLVAGTDWIARCLLHGPRIACGFRPTMPADGQMSPIGPYPLFQYVPDMVAKALGATLLHRYMALSALSIASTIGSLLLAGLVLVRTGKKAWGWAVVLVLITGPMLAYANATWGEALASALLVLVVATTALRAPLALVAAASFAACLTKETGYPFVVAFGLLGLLAARRRTGARLRRPIVALLAGAVGAFVCAALFNELRFGSVFNTNYLQPTFAVPSVRLKLEFAAGLFVSPSGGILLFWTSACVVFAAACAMPLVRRRAGSPMDPWPAVTLLCIVVGLTVGLASWWAPFGWFAWGPRLSLPWVLPLVLLSIVFYGDDLAPFAASLLRPLWRTVLVAALVLLVALPQVAFMWRPQTKDEFFFARDRRCQPTNPIGSARYYECVHEQVWLRHPILLQAMPGLRTPGGALTAIMVAFGTLSCLVLLRAGVLSTRATAED
jgi:hypothetical protein